MELLAPAGSFSAFAAALDEGADAIYIGAPALNARSLARDFTYPEIHALVRAAHAKNVKVYIAMNSLVKESEIDQAVDGLARFAEIKADALIIQDLGLYRLARTHFPQLPLHASTLMGTHNAPGVNILGELGFSRVVLPRELTLEEIGNIHRHTAVELEVFVHGAMCFSYSGFCQFSSMFGGKSSLRGQCVQPCRRRYGWQRKKGFVKQGRQKEKDGGYLFSMHDLCGIDLLPELKHSGVACLKIEGRLKSAEYVRKTVRAYRLLLDELAESEISAAGKKEARRLLGEAMGRRSAPGFFLSSNPPEAVTPGLSGNVGLPVGKVIRLQEGTGRDRGRKAALLVNLSREIRVGDRLRLHDETTGRRFAFTLHHLEVGRRAVKAAKAKSMVRIHVPGRELQGRRGSFRGTLFKVDVGSMPDLEQQIRSTMLRAGGKMPEPDRKNLERISKLIFGPSVESAKNGKQGKRGGQLPVRVMLSTLQERRYKLPFTPESHVVPLTAENIDFLHAQPDNPRRKTPSLIWSLPGVIGDQELEWYGENIRRLVREGHRNFQLGHFSQAELFRHFGTGDSDLRLSGHYTCNILNSMAGEAYRDLRFSEVLFSLETDGANLALALRNLHGRNESSPDHAGRLRTGMYVFGHPPLFTARLQDSRYQYGRRFVSPKNELFVLGRDAGMTIATAVLPFSLLDKRAELAAMGVDYLVVDLRFGNIKRNIAELTSLLKGNTGDKEVLAGNFAANLL